MPEAGQNGGQPSVSATSEQTGKISGLKIQEFSGSRNPQVYEDWKKSVQSVRYVSNLTDAKLAVLAHMSLQGEAKGLCRHIPFESLVKEDGSGLAMLYAVLDKRYKKQEHDNFDFAAAKG